MFGERKGNASTNSYTVRYPHSCGARERVTLARTVILYLGNLFCPSHLMRKDNCFLSLLSRACPSRISSATNTCVNKCVFFTATAKQWARNEGGCGGGGGEA